MKAIFLNEEDITSLYKEGKITLPAMRADGELMVTYEKLTDAPATGVDNVQTAMWAAAMAGCLILTFCFTLRKGGVTPKA